MLVKLIVRMCICFFGKVISGSNWCFDYLMDFLLLVCVCCYVGKSRGFGWFYLLLDLNQWFLLYESEILIVELSRLSWVKLFYKRKLCS